MTFDDINRSMPVLLDANIIIYYHNRASSDCIRLIDRCKRGEVHGIIATPTIIEVCHRVMCEEARKKWQCRRPLDYLKERPEAVRQLTDYALLVDNLLQRSNFGILELSKDIVQKSQQVRSRYGLLTNDSILVQILYEHDIRNIATNDSHFERIEGIQVFKPSDIP